MAGYRGAGATYRDGRERVTRGDFDGAMRAIDYWNKPYGGESGRGRATGGTAGRAPIATYTNLNLHTLNY